MTLNNIANKIKLIFKILCLSIISLVFLMQFESVALNYRYKKKNKIKCSSNRPTWAKVGNSNEPRAAPRAAPQEARVRLGIGKVGHKSWRFSRVPAKHRPIPPEMPTELEKQISHTESSAASPLITNVITIKRLPAS